MGRGEECLLLCVTPDLSYEKEGVGKNVKLWNSKLFDSPLKTRLKVQS